MTEPIPFDRTQITSAKNWSHPKPGDPCHPLAANQHVPMIAFPLDHYSQALEDSTSASSGPVCACCGKSNMTNTASPCCGTGSPERSCMTMSEKSGQTSLLSISFMEDSPAPTLVLQATERDLLASVQDYGTSSIVSLVRSCQSGFSSRTSLGFYPVTAGETLPSSFQGWRTSGMGGPTGFWTANFSVFPKDADVCSLSGILETPGPHLERYTLSARACQGILRRAEKRGRELPKALYHALLAASEVETIPEPTREPQL